MGEKPLFCELCIGEEPGWGSDVTETAVEAIESVCYSAAEHSASQIVPRRLFCGWKRKEPFNPFHLACPAFFAEQPFWSFLLEGLVYAVQMCTMRWFCFLAFQMFTDRKMSFGKGRGLSLLPRESGEPTMPSLCGNHRA